MDVLEQIEGKLMLLEHFQRHLKVPKEVADAAIAKLGADLVDALSGSFGEALLREFEATIDRLNRRELFPGERVCFELDSNEYETEILEVNGLDLVLDFDTRSDSGRRFRIEAGKVTPSALRDLEHLQWACRAALGRSDED